MDLGLWELVLTSTIGLGILEKGKSMERNRSDIDAAALAGAGPGAPYDAIEAAVHLTVTFSEYSDYYEHERAGTRTFGRVSDAPRTVLDWEIGISGGASRIGPAEMGSLRLSADG